MFKLNKVAFCAALIGVYGGCGVAMAAVDAMDSDKSDFAFYYLKESIKESPQDPGSLIRYQPIETEDMAGDLYRVLYWSTARTVHYSMDTLPAGAECELYHWPENEMGMEYRCVQPIITSGLVRVPKAAPPSEGFATVAYTHGTLGSIVDCGPSRGFGPVWREWMTSDRVVTVAADYPGLGYDAGLESVEKWHISWDPWDSALVFPFDDTTHPYFDMWSPGAATVDIVRAGRQLDGVIRAGLGSAVNANFVVVGSSQGGSVALSTGQTMGHGYAPELNLQAVVAGAPGSEMGNLEGSEGGLAQGLLAAGVVGASLVDEGVRPTEWLENVGKANYNRTTEQICSGAGDALSYFWWINAVYSYPFKAELKDLQQRDDWKRFAARQNLTTSPINAPIVVAQVIDDPLVRIKRTRGLVERLKDSDVITGPVTYCVYQGNGDNGIDENGDDNLTFASMENHTVVLDLMGNNEYDLNTPPPLCIEYVKGQDPQPASMSSVEYLEQQGFTGLSNDQSSH